MGIILSDHNHLIFVPFWAIATEDYHVTGTKLHILYDGAGPKLLFWLLLHWVSPV